MARLELGRSIAVLAGAFRSEKTKAENQQQPAVICSDDSRNVEPDHQIVVIKVTAAHHVFKAKEVVAE